MIQAATITRPPPEPADDAPHLLLVDDDRRLRDLPLGRPARGQIQPDPVSRHRFQSRRALGPRPERVPERVGEPARADAAGRHRPGDLLQPDDLAGVRPGQLAHLRRRQQWFGLEAGVDVHRAQAGGPQEPAADLLGAEPGPVVQVLVRPGVRRQPEHWWAPPPHRQPSLRVEQRHPCWPRRLPLFR